MQNHIQVNSDCQFLMFILLLRTLIIHGLCCYVHFHDRKEKVEI